MITIKNMYDLILPEITLPKTKIMLGDFIRVNKEDIESRHAIHTIAKYFMREIKIDSVLSSHPRSQFYDDNECHAYLLTFEKSNVEMKSVVVGGFCFRLRDFGYGMQWIWLHPYVRNSGILSKHWSLFEEKFGKNFYCEPPYTHAMQSFLNRNGNESHMQHDNQKYVPLWLDKLNEVK